MSEFTATTNPAEAGFRQAFELINQHLYTVEERIRQQARTFDTAVEGYVDYVCATGGKRLRPALALLSGGATGRITSGHADLAVILELIHVATLVHDDIMDGADIRREQPTANAKWGNSLSVLLGDALFAHALRLSTGFDNSDICRRIADAAVDVCSGEIVQTQRRFDLKLNLADYYRIIEMKTAALFASACELGAFISDAKPGVINALRIFGLKLGTAYQIYDDCVDLVGDEAEAGKTLGTDLGKGKFTLPVLILLQRSGGKELEQIGNLLLHDGEFDAATLRELIDRQGALTTSVQTGRRMLSEAKQALNDVPPSKYRDGLQAVADYVDSLFVPLG